jgi:hypothetical protein
MSQAKTRRAFRNELAHIAQKLGTARSFLKEHCRCFGSRSRTLPLLWKGASRAEFISTATSQPVSTWVIVACKHFIINVNDPLPSSSNF